MMANDSCRRDEKKMSIGEQVPAAGTVIDWFFMRRRPPTSMIRMVSCFIYELHVIKRIDSAYFSFTSCNDENLK